MLQNRYNQIITYWSEDVIDGFGNRTFKAPVILQGRWEERTDLEIAFEGEVKPSKAVVYLQSDIVLGGFLALGDQTATADPNSLDAAFIIKSFTKMPSVDATEFIRKAML